MPYLDAIAAAGATPVVLGAWSGSPCAAEMTAACDRMDGLVLVGGGDVDPAAYGRAPDPSVYGVDQVRDRAEASWLASFRDRGRPILGICRGLQLLNVTLGGTLIVDVPERSVVHRDVARREADIGRETRHRVRIEPGSRLAAILGCDSCVVVTRHHQAIDRVADGLRVVAWADDGVPEAVEASDGWLVGVQWHPEADVATSEASQKLFAGFVAAARTDVG
jgi:putative glutamine amidotransferase